MIDSGARLLIVDAHSVSVFDASRVRRLRSVWIKPAPVAPSAAAISPDGRAIAIGSRTGRVSFVDPSTGDAHLTIGAHSTPVTTVSYSSNDRVFASTGTDNKVLVWHPQTARPAEVLTAPAEQVQYVAFSPDGTTLYSSSNGGVLLEWDLTGERSFGRRFALGAPSPCCSAVSPLAPPLALSPDGTMFAVRLGSSTVGLFSTHTLHREASFTIRPKGAAITTLAWSPTRPELAVAGYSGIVQLWRVNGTPRLARRLTGLYPSLGQLEAIQALAFSPDGRLLAASDSSNAVEQTGGGGTLAHYAGTTGASAPATHPPSRARDSPSRWSACSAPADADCSVGRGSGTSDWVFASIDQRTLPAGVKGLRGRRRRVSVTNLVRTESRDAQLAGQDRIVARPRAPIEIIGLLPITMNGRDELSARPFVSHQGGAMRGLLRGF